MLPRLIHPLNYYPLLIFYLGTSDVAGSNLARIKGGYRALGMRMKGKRGRWCLLNPVSERGKCLADVDSSSVLWLGCTASVSGRTLASVTTVTVRAADLACGMLDKAWHRYLCKQSSQPNDEGFT